MTDQIVLPIPKRQWTELTQADADRITFQVLSGSLYLRGTEGTAAPVAAEGGRLYRALGGETDVWLGALFPAIDARRVWAMALTQPTFVCVSAVDTGRFRAGETGQTHPAGKAFGILPDDSADLPVIPRALYLATPGSLAVEMAGAPQGEVVIFAGLAAGIPHPIRPRRILATGTTATGLIGLY